MVQVLNGIDLMKGKKVAEKRTYGITQPLQLIPMKEKNDEWTCWNMDWLEWNGIRQIAENRKRFMKNYRLAEGIIDKSDYVPENNNDMKDIVENLIDGAQELEVMELKFFPIIPNVIRTLMSEFSRRDKRITFRAVDEYTNSEIILRKTEDISNELIRWASDYVKNKWAVYQAGNQMDEQAQQQMEEELKPENLQKLPQIQEFYTKNYEVLAEKWASKLQNVDEERFKLDELEETAFKDKLVADREFWHFRMLEDDYDVELWNPVTTFYHKSPSEKYISNAQFVGKIDIMTVADVLDTYGWNMTEEQIKSLQTKCISDIPMYAIGGYKNDGTLYDPTQSFEWNTGEPSLEYRRMVQGDTLSRTNDVVDEIFKEIEDDHPQNRHDMLRVTTAYWKSQRKVGRLTKIDASGVITTQIVTEDYNVTDEPVYDNTLFREKSVRTLVSGEHIDWTWINQSWGGVKIGPNIMTMYGHKNATGFNAIYLGITQNKIKPLKFQFKGEHTLYGCKLPVEGRVFTDRNTRSMSLVDSMKPFQIAYNVVNNQIQDILMDELGTVILIDQNTLPKHSMGEDWGQNNMAKAYVAMKDFSMLPLDTSIANTENAINFQHFQKLDMSQTERLLGRIKLAEYFRQQAFEQVGVSAQRMGQQLAARTSATEAEQTQVGSYAQTEMHFVEHCDQLMPRVHEMRTMLAQYYSATKPSVRLQHTNCLDERTNLEIEGKDIMMRDINVFSTTKANHRRVLDMMKELAVRNNTTGGSIYDLGKILQADSIATMNTALKESEIKMQEAAERERQAQEEMAEKERQAHLEELKMKYDHEMVLQESKNRANILITEIRSAGYGAMMDVDENKRSDFEDYMDKIRESDEFNQTMGLQEEKLELQRQSNADKVNLKREELQTKREIAEKQLEIARENKNKYDFMGKGNKGNRIKKAGSSKKK